MAQIFKVGDKVGWKGGAHNALPGDGPGPFKVLRVTKAEPICPHPRRHRNIINCPSPNLLHPQSVTIGDWETGRFINILSGSLLKKVR